MTRIKRLSAPVALILAASGCGIFEDPTPETISVQISGSAGTPVLAIYSQRFVAGINQETRTTEVRISESDSVMQTLPIDTVIDIAESRQFFIQVETTVPDDTANVSVEIDVDTRNVLSRAGLILPGEPWRYVYQFNRQLTSIVEVVF